MNYIEYASIFTCNNDSLVSIVSMPEQGSRYGILLLVGGPQVRCGSHRQFTLMARIWAAAGISVMRFDFRGMGDSTGEPRNFMQVSDDINAAVGHFFSICPDLREIVLWGLCDAASAALLYVRQDPRIAGLALCNPWVRTPQTQADVYLQHYYFQRLYQAEFWHKLLSGQFRPMTAWRSLQQLLSQRHAGVNPTDPDAALSERMASGLQSFNGPVLIILCENDFTAREFMQLCRIDSTWRNLLAAPRITQYILAQANHTFSQANWRHQIADWTSDWLQKSLTCD
jgi:exosortase A-associated hydrolase 1